MRMKHLLAPGLAVALCSGFLTPVHAQLDQHNLVGTTTSGITTANFYFARPNDLTIIVSIMGAVQRPGRYEISKSIDLVNLLALAGGPTAEGTTSDVRISRLVESGAGVRMQDLVVDLSNLSRVKPADLVLQPGDIIQIERTGWATARTIFEVVVGSAVVVTAISQVIIASHR